MLYTPSNQTSSATPEFSDRQILADFVDQVIIPTYTQLSQDSEQLAIAINALAANPSEATLQAARQAWFEARAPWEQSEAYAFGPAASLGYDADLDDWPVNEVDVKAVLNSQDALTEDHVGNLQTTQKGFHTIEFLLFGDNNNKVLSDFSERDLTYLTLLGRAFDQAANNLLSSWTTGVEGYPAYRDEFVNAGETSTAYPTLAAAAEEIVQGILGILDELANAKIGEPLEAQNPFLLESRFSNSSLRDFEYNLRSVQYAYLGSTTGETVQSSLSDYVQSIDPTLDIQEKPPYAIAPLAVILNPPQI